MPTTIYDASQITYRRRNKAEAGDFTTRIQNLTYQPQSTTGYAPRLGIYDQSIINQVKRGNMVYYRKGDGGLVTVNNGCPCAALPLNGCTTN